MAFTLRKRTSAESMVLHYSELAIPEGPAGRATIATGEIPKAEIPRAVGEVLRNLGIVLSQAPTADKGFHNSVFGYLKPPHTNTH